VFWRSPKNIFGIDDGIDNLLEQLPLPKEKLFGYSEEG
jgi:hypothetical protein